MTRRRIRAAARYSDNLIKTEAQNRPISEASTVARLSYIL